MARHFLLNPVLGRMYYDLKSADISLLSEPPINENAVKWTFRIKRNLTFHTGEPVKAATLKISLEWMYSSPFNTPELSMLSGYLSPKNIEIQDEFTLVFHLAKPCLWFDHILSSCIFSPVPSKELVPPKDHLTTAAQDSGAHLAWRRFPVGAGPYKVVEVQDSGQRVILERNSTSQNKSKRAFDRLILSSGPFNDDADMAIGFETNPNPMRLEQLATSQTFKYHGIYFDYRSSLARKRDFRRAVSMAIDSPELMKAAPNDLHNRLMFRTKNRSSEFEKVQNQLVGSFNQEEARKILKAIGLYHQKPLLISGGLSAPIYWTALQKQLEEVGLNVEYVQNGAFSGDQNQAEQTPFCLVGFIPSLASDFQVFQLFRNKSAWIANLDEVSKEYEELIDQALTITQVDELPTLNLRLLKIFCEEAYSIPLFEFPVVLFLDPDKVDPRSVEIQDIDVVTPLLSPLD